MRKIFGHTLTFMETILAVTTIAIVGTWLQVGWWLFYPYEPIVVESPIKIVSPVQKVVSPGSMLFYKITYCKKMDVTGLLSRKLINNVKIDLRDAIATAPVGRKSEIVPIEIPEYAPSGQYHLWWSVRYQVNPVRSIIVSVISESFEVTK